MIFTEEQAKIISHITGYAVVVAGPGSGKTRCLIERTANLIKKGADPSRILLFTFTKKAADEIASRVAKRLASEEGVNSSAIYISTIHSLALLIFRENQDHFGYTTLPTIWSPDRRGKLIRTFIKRVLGTKSDPFGHVFDADKISELECNEDMDNIDMKEDQQKVLKELLDLTKKALKMYPPTPSNISGISPEDYYDRLRTAGNGLVESTVATLFLLAKENCNIIEFEDMIPAAIKILGNSHSCHWRNKFTHLMIDEYQDVNDINVAFLEHLVGPQTVSVMAVGDDDQSIYGFRGGNNKHILEFPNKFGGSIYYLTKNFRSTPNIVNFSNEFIAKNTNRYDKKMVPHSTNESRIVMNEPYRDFTERDKFHFGEYEQHEEVFERIYNLVHFSGVQPKEIAILARNNFNLLKAHGIYKSLNAQFPAEKRIRFDISNIRSTFDVMEVKKVILWCNVLINPKDHVSLREALMSSFSGFGVKSGDYIKEIAINNPSGSISKWLRLMHTYPRHGKKTKKYTMLCNFADGIDVAMDLLSKDRSVCNFWKTAELLSRVRYELRKKMTMDAKSMKSASFALDALEESETFVRSFAVNKDIGPLMQYQSLMDNIATEISLAVDNDAVQLSTIHASKGKEWDVVFLIDVVADVLPGRLSDDIEEERRLAYVGITRAAKQLYISRYEGELAPMISEFWTEMAEGKKASENKIRGCSLSFLEVFNLALQRAEKETEKEAQASFIGLNREHPPTLHSEEQNFTTTPHIMVGNLLLWVDVPETMNVADIERRKGRRLSFEYAKQNNLEFICAVPEEIENSITDHLVIDDIVPSQVWTFNDKMKEEEEKEDRFLA